MVIRSHSCIDGEEHGGGDRTLTRCRSAPAHGSSVDPRVTVLRLRSLPLDTPSSVPYRSRTPRCLLMCRPYLESGDVLFGRATSSIGTTVAVSFQGILNFVATSVPRGYSVSKCRPPRSFLSSLLSPPPRVSEVRWTRPVLPSRGWSVEGRVLGPRTGSGRSGCVLANNPGSTFGPSVTVAFLGPSKCVATTVIAIAVSRYRSLSPSSSSRLPSPVSRPPELGRP